MSAEEKGKRWLLVGYDTAALFEVEWRRIGREEEIMFPNDEDDFGDSRWTHPPTHGMLFLTEEEALVSAHEHQIFRAEDAIRTFLRHIEKAGIARRRLENTGMAHEEAQEQVRGLRRYASMVMSHEYRGVFNGE